MARLVEERVLVGVAVAAVDAANEAAGVGGAHWPYLQRGDCFVAGLGRVGLEHLLVADVGAARADRDDAGGEVAVLAASADMQLVDEAQRREAARGSAPRFGGRDRQPAVADLDQDATR